MEKDDATRKPASLSDFLAAERTLLAWFRTSLALMGFGFVVARFGLFLQEVQSVRGGLVRSSTGASLWFGIGLIASGVVVTVMSGLRHMRLVKALKRGDEAAWHSSALAAAVAVLLAIIGIGMAIYLFDISIRRG